jgi:threonine dehydratase
MEQVMSEPSFSMQLVAEAAERLKGRVVRTPVLSSPMLDREAGCRVFVKAESLQRTGAFKFRGALNKLLTLEPDVRARGIVAFSSGNHGHAVAAAAAEVGCPATIVLPHDAARIKIENCRWWGAEIVLYDPDREDREEVGARVAGPRNSVVVPPFDDHDIMAGQATCGLEFAEQFDELSVVPDALLVACSGGGLSSGTIAAMTHRFAGVTPLVVEPEGLDKMARSLAAGRPLPRPAGPKTLMDGLSGPITGTRTFRVLQACHAQGLGVTDHEVLAAMALSFRVLKLVLEPAGAATLAALLRYKDRFAGQTVAVICSGGNVDPDVYVRALQGQ